MKVAGFHCIEATTAGLAAGARAGGGELPGAEVSYRAAAIAHRLRERRLP